MEKEQTKDFKVTPPTWGYAGSPVIEGDILLLNAGVSGIALNKKSGKKIWVSRRGTRGYATPVIYDWNDGLICRNNQGDLIYIDLKK
ncbi:MAG TPA: hypothetical protein ENI15_14930 [Spirochaetes bacterium]|nr:hypothetical protein [Spirochaetota bacterium]